MGLSVSLTGVADVGMRLLLTPQAAWPEHSVRSVVCQVQLE